MRHNRRNIKQQKTIIIFIILALCLFNSCYKKCITQKTPETESNRQKIDVRITGIIKNDLGQIMIFSEDKDNNKFIFVKDFYTDSKSRIAMRQKMKLYLKSIKRYKYVMTKITYKIDSIGQKTIYKIEPAGNFLQSQNPAQ